MWQHVARCAHLQQRMTTCRGFVAPVKPYVCHVGWHYLSNATCLIRPHFCCIFCHVKDHRNSLHRSLLSKKSCVRQGVLDKWFPLIRTSQWIPPSGYSLQGGCSGRGVQWIGVVSYSQLVIQRHTNHYTLFPLHPPLRNVEDQPVNSPLPRFSGLANEPAWGAAPQAIMYIYIIIVVIVLLLLLLVIIIIMIIMIIQIMILTILSLHIIPNLG